MDRSWMNIEGFIQPINNSAGLHKLKENSCQNWFVIEDESKLLYYNQSNKDDLPNAHPEGSISLSSGKLEVFVVLTVSDDGKSYLLYPGKDENISEWLSNIKDKTNLVDETTMALQRNYQDSFMTRVRNSFRRKKKPTRSISQDSQSSDKLTMRRSSHSPLPTEDTLGELSESPFKRHVDSARKMKAKRSQSCPNESLFDVRPIISHSEKKHYADKCCDTSSLVSVDWVITDECTKQQDQSTQTFNSQHAEEALKDALMLLARSMPIENKEQTTTHQPAMNYASGVMTLQQQKLIRGLEMEICKLKCEVINLIQGTINIPLKDDDLADWHYVEEIRYKERIFELLREARLCNPRLPNYDSSSSGNFKDAYGFIHGNRESDSVLFHYVCRELIQHYSSFFQDKAGHVKFWNEYVNAKKANDDMVLFKERELKRLIEDGIPACCRSDVWNCFIQEKLEGELIQKQGLYSKLVKITSAKKNKLKSEMTEVERQIRCDLLRTMPSNEDFKTLDSIGVQKLSRILHAFVEYKPEVGYLQGMNFLVGMFLLFMEEEDAFWSLCAVVEVYLKNYFDQILSGAQADQEVLKDLIAETMPVLNAHFKYHGVDISTVTFNWLITLYLDAVPFETAVRIWDCFLFNGREVLFRIALGLLKLQQRSLLQLYGYMEIMQYMKRAARVTYDIDRLFKASFDEITKFPDNDELDEMQKKYRPDIEAKNDFRLMVKHERKRSRGNSFNVKITTPDRSDRLDHIQIVECAVAVSKDLSKPVCIPCSVRGETKVYLLDMNKQEIRSLETNIESRVLCADVLGDGTILIGTVSWYIYAFSLDFCDDELWSIQLNDSVIDLCHYEHDTEDKVYAALADGSIAVLPNANLAGAPTQGSHVRIGSAPVMCVTLVDNKVWCGCSNNIVVLETSTLEEVHALVVSSSARHQVALLIAGDHGVWCTIRGSSWVILIHPESYDILLQVNVASDTNIIDAINVDMQVTVSPFQDSRVTTVLPFREELWVGLGNGQVLIFDIADSRKHNEITTISEENVQYLEGKCSMKMRVHYRISEEPIRSLLVLRDSDGPIILSCAGTLSPEGGISVWQKEITEEDFEEWMPCPVRDNSHLIPVSPRSTAIPTIEIS